MGAEGPFYNHFLKSQTSFCNITGIYIERILPKTVKIVCVDTFRHLTKV